MVIPPEQLFYRIHFEPTSPRAEENTPIVFLHGLMGFAANWGKIWPYFYQERRVLVLDQRGHGKSAKPPSGYSPAEYAADLSNLLQFLEWEKAHIVGHSMGGRVAMIFAKIFSKQCASLTLEDSGAESRPDREKWIRDLLGSIPTPFLDRQSMKVFFTSQFADDPLTGSFLQTNLLSADDGSIDWRFSPKNMIESVLLGRCQDFSTEFGQLSQPTLIVRGERSKEFLEAEAMRMQESRRNAQLVTISGAGHYVHAEKPAEFAAALQIFLDKLS